MARRGLRQRILEKRPNEHELIKRKVRLILTPQVFVASNSVADDHRTPIENRYPVNSLPQRLPIRLLLGSRPITLKRRDAPRLGDDVITTSLTIIPMPSHVFRSICVSIE